jgi:hypothetical protein
MLKVCTLTLGVIASLSLHSEEDKGYVAKKQQPSYADQPMTSQNPCSTLTADEQTFASKLNSTNSSIFCSKMTPMQRQKSMQMASTKGPSNMRMSPDEAVQQVMAGSNPNAPGSKACPVQ